MVDQVKITKIADTVETMVNAVMTSGTINSTSTPISINSVVKAKLRRGTLLLDNRWKILGALFWLASPNSIRLEEKTPLLADDAADVSTTKVDDPGCCWKPCNQEQFDKRAFDR